MTRMESGKPTLSFSGRNLFCGAYTKDVLHLN